LHSYAHIYEVLEQVAPRSFAEDWDNTGLLLEPRTEEGVSHILLTIDLTEAVMAEALRLKVDLIVAYHPPLFIPTARITQADAKSRILLAAAQHGIPIYAPHTALDNVEGGVNDWLADGLGVGTRASILPSATPDHPGIGRRVELKQAISLATLQNRIKAHLGLKQLRVARTAAHRRAGSKVKTIHLCAGAGGSVLAGSPSDVYFTGEMRHHDVLAANEAGVSVLLSEHTHTERGFLPVFRKRLQGAGAKGVKISISRADHDPLEIV
jgi:dinuclear metal center YbgI/SA1388 family protein